MNYCIEGESSWGRNDLRVNLSYVKVDSCELYILLVFMFLLLGDLFLGEEDDEDLYLG